MIPGEGMASVKKYYMHDNGNSVRPVNPSTRKLISLPQIEAPADREH